MTPLVPEAGIENRGREILHGCKRCLLAASCVLMLVATCFATGDSSATKPCRDSVDSYIGYKLSDVRLVTPLAIKTPLSFLFGSQKKFEDEFAAVLAQLSLKKGDPFDRAAHNAAMQLLFERYQEAVVSPGERIRVAFVTFRFENCDDAARTVGLTYLVYSSEFLYHASRIFEKPNDRFTRSLAPGKLANAGSLVNTSGKLLPQPIVGYDRERELFGGGKAVLNTENGVINQMAVDAMGSANSATADFNLAGNKEFTHSFLSYVDWRFAYNYFNLPSDLNRIKAGTGLAQIFGASKPLGRSDLLFRFGASLEGGNRQSELPVNDPELAQLLGYGALKAYLGATANHGRRSWSASYAFQLSNDGSDASLDYTKHVFDAGYRLRYLWREHFPFRMEAQFSAGAIRTHGGPVPVAERFFGGNRIRPFIDGDDWIINSVPFIRSFPQTTFNLVGLNAPFGGEHFFSANLTLSQPVWNFPAVPKEISQEPLVRDALGGALRTARNATVKSYVEDDRQYLAIRKDLVGDPAAPATGEVRGNLIELAQAVDQVDQQLTTLNSQNPPSAVADAIAEVGNDPDFGADLVGDSKDAIEAARTDPDAFRAKARQLILGSKGMGGLIPRLATALDKVVETLRAASLPAPAKQLSDTAATLKQIQAKMEPQVTTLIHVGEVKVDVFKPVMAVVKNDASSDDVDDVVKQIATTVAGIKTRANTMPAPGRAALFQPADIKLPKKLAVKLRDGQDPVSAFLSSQFRPETRELLKAYKETPGSSDQLVGAMVSELNRLLSGPSLFTKDRFSNIDLSDETEELSDSNPQGPALLALNRALLAEAYPSLVSHSQIDETLEPLDGYINDAKSALDALVDFESADADQVRGPVHQLVIGFGGLAPPITASISTQIKNLQPSLVSAGFATEAKVLLDQSGKLSSHSSVLGSTGERVHLDEREYLEAIEISRAAVSDFAFIVGAGQQSTLGTIKEIKTQREPARMQCSSSRLISIAPRSRRRRSSTFTRQLLMKRRCRCCFTACRRSRASRSNPKPSRV
jgi:hypothetical protein